MKPIKRVPVVTQVVANMKELIAERDLKPGDKFPTEKEFSHMFGVGRSSIREALRVLQTKGVIEICPGKGAYITEKNEGY